MTTPSGAPAAPAGWYTDPQMAATLRYWDGGSWTQHVAPAPQQQAMPAFAPAAGHFVAHDPATTVRRLADYAKYSGLFWIILGAIQIAFVVTAIAGVWNVIVGVQRMKMSSRIAAGDPTVPRAVEGMAGLVVIGVINLFLGAVVGLILVGVDFFVRDQILKNRHLFHRQPALAGPPVAQPAQYGVAS